MKHYVDVHVGRLLRYYRFMAGMTQHQVGEAVGIKFQQIQKYESGANRVSASRLHDIAGVLGVPAARFFEGIDSEGEAPEAVQAEAANGVPEVQSVENAVSVQQFTDKEALEFVRCFYRLSDEPRRRLLDLTKSLANAA